MFWTIFFDNNKTKTLIKKLLYFLTIKVYLSIGNVKTISCFSLCANYC